MLNNRETGKLGEKIAREDLLKKGYSILETNYSTRYGEIDIIAVEGRVVVFVEVKTRRGINFGYPREAVNRHKQLKIKNMAEVYILRKKLRDINMRFDVIEVFLDDNNDAKSVTILKNAFE
jgi:putative endonuclease